MFAAAVGMPDDCRSLAVNLNIQYGRLKKWGHITGFNASKDGNTVTASIRISYLPLVAIFTEIRTLMQSFAKINSKFVELQDDHSAGAAGDLHEFDEQELQEAFDSVVSPFQQPDTKRSFFKASKEAAKGVGGVLRHPKRLKWAFKNKDDFVSLLKRLEALIDCLNEFLTGTQLEKLQQTTNDTYLEMLQVRNNVSDLLLLAEASHHISGKRLGEANLLKLARFKLLHTSVSKQASSQEPIPFKNIILKTDAEVGIGRSGAIFKPVDQMQLERHVWVEWKEYELQYQENGQLALDPEILNRIKELAVLLTSEKPDEFCIPPCIGYTDSRTPNNNTGFLGYIFECPNSVPAASKPISILEVISGKEKYNKPSLTNRVALAHKVATCILYLHSVNWLHKGIRSENIICFAKEGEPQISEPYLTGFDYSRQINEGTEAPPIRPAWEICRFPDIQGDGPKPHYRKTFDMYSLGIVLLEVASWKGISEIMGISNIEKARPDETKEVRARLLSKESDILETLRAEVGDQYHDAVKSCIRGRDSFGISEEDEETSTEAGILLQQRFQDEVVRKLQGLVI